MTKKYSAMPFENKDDAWFYAVVATHMSDGDDYECTWKTTWKSDFLCVAVYFGWERYVESKLNHNTRLANSRDRRPLICYAINCGQHFYGKVVCNGAMVLSLISHGADINHIYEEMTPWHLAVAIAHHECSRTTGHDFDKISDDVKWNWLGLFHDLLDYGADPNIRIGHYDPDCPHDPGTGQDLGNSLYVLTQIFRNQTHVDDVQTLLSRVRTQSDINEKEERRLARLKPETDMTVDEVNRRAEEEAFERNEIIVENYGVCLEYPHYKRRTLSEDSNSHRKIRNILTEEYERREQSGFLDEPREEDTVAWEATLQILRDEGAN